MKLLRYLCSYRMNYRCAKIVLGSTTLKTVGLNSLSWGRRSFLSRAQIPKSRWNEHWRTKSWMSNKTQSKLWSQPNWEFKALFEKCRIWQTWTTLNKSSQNILGQNHTWLGCEFGTYWFNSAANRFLHFLKTT